MKAQQVINEQPETEDFLSKDHFRTSAEGRARYKKAQERKRFIRATTYTPNYGFDEWCA